MTDRGQRYQRSDRERSRDRLTNKEPSTSPFKQGSSRHQTNKITNQSHQQSYSHGLSKNIQNLTELNKVIQNLPTPIKNSQVQFLSPYFQKFILTNDLKSIFKTFFRMFVKSSPQQAIYKSFYNLLKSGKSHLQQVLKKYAAIIRSIIQILCQKFQDKYIEHVKHDKNWQQFLLVSAYNQTINFKSVILLIKKVIQKQMSISSEIIRTYYEIIISLIQQNFCQSSLVSLVPLVSSHKQKQKQKQSSSSQKVKNFNNKKSYCYYYYSVLPMIIRQIECVLMKRFKSQIHAQILKYIQEVQKFQSQLVNVNVNVNSSVQSKQKQKQKQKQKSIYLGYLRYNTIVFLIMFQYRICPQFYSKLLSRYYIQNKINKQSVKIKIKIKNHPSKQKKQSLQQEQGNQLHNQYINLQYSFGILSRFWGKDYLNFQQNQLLMWKKSKSKSENEIQTKNLKKQNEEIQKQKVQIKKDNPKQSIINTDTLSQNIKMKASSSMTVSMYHKLLFTLLIQKQKSSQKDKQQKQKQQNNQSHRDYKQSMVMEQEVQELINKQNQQKQYININRYQELNLMFSFILLSPFRICQQEVQFNENYLKIKQKMLLLSTRKLYYTQIYQNNYQEQVQLQQQQQQSLSKYKYKQNQHLPLHLPLFNTQKVFSHLLSAQIQVLFQTNHHLYHKLINILASSKQPIQQNQSNNNNNNNNTNNNELHQFDFLQQIFVHNNNSFSIQKNKSIYQNNFMFEEVKNQLKIILNLHRHLHLHRHANESSASNQNQNYFIKSSSCQSQSDIPFIIQTCFKFIVFVYLLIKNQTIQKLIMQIRKYQKQICQNLIINNLKNKNGLNAKSGSVQRSGLNTKSGSVQRSGLNVKSSQVQRFEKIQKQKSQQRQKQLSKKQKKQMSTIQVQQKQAPMKSMQNQQQAQIKLKELMQTFKKQGIRQLQNNFYKLLTILLQQVLSTFTFNSLSHPPKQNSKEKNNNKYKKMVYKQIIQLTKHLIHDIKMYAKKSQNQFQAKIQLLNKTSTSTATNKNNLNQKQQQENNNFENRKFIMQLQQQFCINQSKALAWCIKRLQQQQSLLYQKQCQQETQYSQNGQTFSLKKLLFPNKNNTIFQKLTQITKLQLKLQQIYDQNNVNTFLNFDKKSSFIYQYQQVIIKKKIELYQKQLLTQVSTSILSKQKKQNMNDIYVYQKAEEILYELFRFSINNQENYQKLFTMNASSCTTVDYEKNSKKNNQIIYSAMIRLLDFGKSTKKTLKELSFQTIPKCQKISSQILTFLTGTLKNTQLLNSKIRKLIFMFYDKVNQHTISTFIQNRKLFTLQAMIASNYKMKTLAELLLKEEINSKQLQMLFLNSNSVLENNNDEKNVIQQRIDEQNQKDLQEEQKELDIVKLYLKFLVNKDGPALKYELNQRLKMKNKIQTKKQAKSISNEINKNLKEYTIKKR